jgi:hypothetical protein
MKIAILSLENFSYVEIFAPFIIWLYWPRPSLDEGPYGVGAGAPCDGGTVPYFLLFDRDLYSFESKIS